jgi:putative addiction module CopG family antidote
MSITLSPEDQQKAEALIASGRFLNLDAVIHAGIDALEEDADWNEYASDRIAAGLEDIEAGRVIDGDDFLEWLRSQRQQQA